MLELINDISVTLSKILLVLGLPYIFLKIIDKGWNNQSYKDFYRKVRLPLYFIHVNFTKIAIILGFIHGIIITPIDQVYVITGWIFGIISIILLGIGVRMSIKNGSRPMNEEEDIEWKTGRNFKWILTPIVIVLFLLHYFLYHLL